MPATRIWPLCRLHFHRIPQVRADVVQGDEHAKLVAHRCRGSRLTELFGIRGRIRGRARPRADAHSLPLPLPAGSASS